MSQFTVYLKAPDYLDQWLRHDFWDEETGRVAFPRGSAPMAVMEALLRKAPNGITHEDTDGLLPVKVPTFRGINPASRNYLTKEGKSAVVQACKRVFRAMLFKELQMTFAHDVQITDIIYDFLDRHGIEPSQKNWETVRQMYARLRKKSLSSEVNNS